MHKCNTGSQSINKMIQNMLKIKDKVSVTLNYKGLVYTFSFESERGSIVRSRLDFPSIHHWQCCGHCCPISYVSSI